jgi:hypothetical protein
LLSAGGQGEVETAGVWKHFPHAEWPINYGIADLGVDPDIAFTQAALKQAEVEKKKNWTLPEDFKWKDLPHVDAEFKL